MGDGIRCMLMRGGTSKGAYFLAEDLPRDPADRDDLLLRIVGSPDARQIDGIGGAHPLTSKVAVIGPSDRAAADVDYLFLQVAVDQATVSDRQNCGNLLAGVGPFAVERGLGAVTPGQTRFDVEHPAGHLQVEAEIDTTSQPPRVIRSAVVRTARKLFDGTVFPRSPR
jgi:2-methylaconitate cis-trans-isomerase PrpF